MELVVTAYIFETIGVAQALAYNASTDSLSFTTPGSTAGATRFAYDSQSGQVAVTSNATGRTVVFGHGFDGEGDIGFPDGSTAYTARVFTARPLTGGAGDDALFGGRIGYEFSGGAGNDTLVGGLREDGMRSGPGNDLIILYPRDASPDGFGPPGPDSIYDWSPSDRLSFGPLVVTAANYAETTTDGAQQGALAAANALIGSGAADVVAVQVGFGVMIFADANQDNGVADVVVQLANSVGSGFTLANIDAGQFVTTPAPGAFAAPPAEPKAPPPPASPVNTGGTITGNMDAVHVGALIGGNINQATPTYLGIASGLASLSVAGTGFTYDVNDQLVAGTITNLNFVATVQGGSFSASMSLPGVSAAPFGQWLDTDNTPAAFTTLFAGANGMVGGNQHDLIRGYGGDDLLQGRGGGDSLYGGEGNDQIFANLSGENNEVLIPGAHTLLRGEAGDDYMVGGQGFDDMHGNMGNDTESGGVGDDWVVGGQGDDMLYGDAGHDVVYGNLGADTQFGGDGRDWVRGGQANDSLGGGAGDDFMSGDRGDDTLTGGAGADIFNTFGAAGIDRVLDFNGAEGDRVLLEPGTTYGVSQAGADTVISMGGGGQMVLVGVTLSSLPAGWIVGG